MEEMPNFLIWCSKSLSLNPFFPLQSRVSLSLACIFRSSHTELLIERPIHAGFFCKESPTIVQTPGWSLGNNSSTSKSLILPFPLLDLFFASIRVFGIVLYRLWASFSFLIYSFLLLAAFGLRCCARAFSSWGERGLVFIAVRGLLIAVAPLVAEHGL